MEPEGLLPCSKEPANTPYHETDVSSPYLPTLIPLRSTLILSFHLRLDLPSSLST
jgi:hypothetical protein